mmetsp:Transcript_36460/g.91742  ORF Transcript_36460/g.91742 Transcript_36460/m.91742 type:complete len:229 (+) Transcript_36460:83-769(+)
MRPSKMSEHRAFGTHSFCSKPSKSISRHWFSMKQRTAFTVRAWMFLLPPSESPPLLFTFSRNLEWSGCFAASLARSLNSLHMSSHHEVSTSTTLPPFIALSARSLASARLGTPAATISSSMASRLSTYLLRCGQGTPGSFFSHSWRYSVGWQLAKSRSIHSPLHKVPRTRLGVRCIDEGFRANHLPIESDCLPFLYVTSISDLPCDSFSSFATTCLCSAGMFSACCSM